jgi:hypothetical protein
MKSIFAAALLACATGAGAAEITKTLSSAGIKILSVDTDAGNVEITAGGEGIEVEVTRFDPARCALTMAPKGATMVLKAETRARTGFFRKGCEAGFKVTAPAVKALM